MKLTCTRDAENMRTLYSLSISDPEFVRAYYDKWDKLLIDEVEECGKISDKLLALEVIARKIEGSK